MIGWIEWATAATVASAIVGVATFVVLRLDRARTQARRVWPCVVSCNYDGATREGNAEIDVVNDSDGPIFECALSVLSWDWRTASDPDRKVVGRYYATIPPGERSAKDPDDRLRVGALPEGMTVPAKINPPVELRFDDAQGRRWIREPSGRLKRERRRLLRLR